MQLCLGGWKNIVCIFKCKTKKSQGGVKNSAENKIKFNREQYGKETSFFSSETTRQS